VAHNFKHGQIKSVSRTHAIRCYYGQYLLDQSYYDLLITEISSNERYVRRKENLPEDKLRVQLNFLVFVKKLATMRISGKLKPNQQELMINELFEQKITISRSGLIGVIKNKDESGSQGQWSGLLWFCS
jgi:hypothetical protein